MASTDQCNARDLIAEISKDGPRFRFFQAVRLLALSAQKEDGPAPPIPPALRFGTPLSLSFPASEILDVEPLQDVEPLPQEDRLALMVTIGFMGLTGPSGVLPNTYTEMLIERRNVYRDTTAHRFFDLFTHRAVSLFYEVWRKHRFYIEHEAGNRDRFTRNLLDLTGIGLAPLQSRLRQANGGVPDGFLCYFSGLLSQKPISATNIAMILRAYFNVPAEVEQWVGQWVPVPESQQACLGKHACVLGENAFSGKRIWDRQNKICIKLGPLTDTEFNDFLPGQPGTAALQELVRFCVGRTVACDLRLILKKECIPPAQLAGKLAGKNTVPFRLGYNSWLHTTPPLTDANDARFSLLE